MEYETDEQELAGVTDWIFTKKKDRKKIKHVLYCYKPEGRWL